jgi:hypothetical protein
MREIPYFSLGTYYTTRAQTEGPNAFEMRNLVYHAKDNNRGAAIVNVGHAWHPGEFAERVACATDAWDYVADMIAANKEAIFGALGLPRNPLIQWVPVPSSVMVRWNHRQVRCCGREIGARLEARGIGSLAMLVCNKQPSNGITTIEQFYDNYELLAHPNREAWQIYLDDVLTWGKHVAALDRFLGEPNEAKLLTIARTDKGEHDAYEVRTGKLKVSQMFGATYVEFR